MLKITLTIDLDEDFMSDVLITAFDGDLGACWYWASPANDGWLSTSGTGTWGTGKHWKQCAVVDALGSDGPRIEWPVYLVDDKVIAKGIQQLISREAPVNNSIRESIAAAVASGDAGDIDADAADVIVQVGLFGQVVYG